MRKTIIPWLTLILTSLLVTAAQIRRTYAGDFQTLYGVYQPPTSTIILRVFVVIIIPIAIIVLIILGIVKLIKRKRPKK